MKVSVLVPVYGVERYIEQCARTLFGQTYHDLEYIFVDDCSLDNSIQLLRQVLTEFPQRETQVKVVRHDRNRGLGAARKTALEMATGDFVFNVDSDDYLSLDAVEKLVKRQQVTGADIVSSAFSTDHGDHSYCDTTRSKKELSIYHEPHYDKQTCLRLMLIQHTLLPHIWARLIRRSLYTDYGISSVEGINMAEDMALTSRLIHVAHTIAYLEDVTYYYRDESSASTFATVSAKHVLSYVKANQELWTWFSQHDPSHTYLFALETGMLNVFHQALTAGFTKRQIADVLTYQPKMFLFRLLYRLLAHSQTLPLLRLAYLSVKWYCKKTNHTLLRYYPER